MKRHIYVSSLDNNFNFPQAHLSKEEALKYGAIKRLIRVETEIPEIEEENKKAEEVIIK